MDKFSFGELLARVVKVFAILVLNEESDIQAEEAVQDAATCWCCPWMGSTFKE